MLISTVQDIDKHMRSVLEKAAATQAWFAAVQTHDPLVVLRRMKFEPVGWHPIDGHALNLVEQVNQTWTCVAALAATRLLLTMHPEAGGFHLAPGAHAARELDVMSVAEGLVGAETFAAVHPSNNRKLAADRNKLSMRNERHRYVFFMSPAFPGTTRLPQLETDGVQVWSVDIE